MSNQEIIICNLCAGSPEIELYPITTYNKNQVKVDICIGKEIQQLINSGVETHGCCCGHGDTKPSCLIDISSKDVLNKLGYEIHDFSKEHSKCGIYEIYLKTDIQCELGKVLKNKVFRYLKEGD
jgi:hypothetical protein